jgi:hypothetical protein
MVVKLLSLPLLLAQLPVMQGGLLGLMRPQVEAQMTRECQKAMAKAEGGFAALEGMCADLARPASVCVVQEIERSGNVMQVAAEAMSGRVGPASMQVAATCLTRLMQTARPSWDQQFPVR